MHHQLLKTLVALAALSTISTDCATAPTGQPIQTHQYTEPIRVACIGDSITFGAAIEDRLANSYPAQLARTLGPNWDVRNFGVSAATLLKNGNNPYWKLKAYQQALAFKPHAIVIKLGTNDSKPNNWDKHKDEFAPNYLEFIDSFKQDGKRPHTWLCLPVPAYPGSWGITDKVMKDEVIPRIHEVAKQANVPTIDLYSALSGKPEFFPDTVHPNKHGARIIAQEVHRALTGSGPAAAKPATPLPRVLLIGDSISLGYTKSVRVFLEGRADVHRIPGNGGHTGRGLEHLDMWLGKNKWDVIHFNWGLWDLCYRPDGSKVNGRDKVNGTITWTLPEYEANLRKLVKQLKRTGAELIWCATTPVPDGESGRHKGDDLKYNAAAAAIMRENGITINDLHTYALRRIPEIQAKPNDVHFTNAGYQYLAQAVASSILRKLHDAGKCDSIAAPFPGKQSQWNAYSRYDFSIDGRKCIVVLPRAAAPGRPWIWRARFFGHEPQTDLALLAKGYHLVYMEVGGLFGSPQAVSHWNRFYEYLTLAHDLSPKVALEGMSRGGLIIYNWAAANPRNVACIYGDAPVCDFKSWPAGKGEGKFSAPTWQQCLRAYGMTEAAALAYNGNPIDNLAPLAKAKIPLLNICGAADKVVPFKENTQVLAERYKKLGGSIEVIAKEGVDHHPHSLKDPAPIVKFILEHQPPAPKPK